METDSKHRIKLGLRLRMLREKRLGNSYGSQAARLGIALHVFPHPAPRGPHELACVGAVVAGLACAQFVNVRRGMLRRGSHRGAADRATPWWWWAGIRHSLSSLSTSSILARSFPLRGSRP